MNISPRVRAIQILQSVILKHKSLQDCFIEADTPFIYQLTYGTLRFYSALQAMANYALKQPLSLKDQDIYFLILLGFYQIQYLDIPEYAIVKETVDVADDLKKSWAKKLINAILRRFLRERNSFEQQCLCSEEAQYAHPQWFIDRVKVAWPAQWQKILQANNEKAPMHLRVNSLKISRDDYLNDLNNQTIEAFANHNENGICLTQAMDVHQLPGFREGCISVQDVASQAVVEYLDLQPEQRVLDACAAPGGKTCHILEREPELSELIALDVSAERLQRITENLNRLKLHATLISGDAALPETWWDQKMFDRILLDAPCSATGVIRRHPDIKWLRTPKEIQQAVEKQKQMLEALWPLLKSDGRLVYTTCSVLPEENEKQIVEFLKNHSEAKCLLTRQILPGNLDNPDNSDGFFYAVLQKI